MLTDMISELVQQSSKSYGNWWECLLKNRWY